MPGKLYVVATPIGNLEDITLRAIRVLKEVSLIAAEDTRNTKKLLNHYGIFTPLTSYYEHNEKEKAPFLISRLLEGFDVAVVSDAGTPGISDPGYRLIKTAVESSVQVIPIPGPSAVISLISISGMPTDEFTFKGFLPSKEMERKKFLLGLKVPEHTFVLYESAVRIKETLRDMEEVLGGVEVTIGRELTKMYEEVIRGGVKAVSEALKDRELKGEITLLVRTGRFEEGRDPLLEIEDLLASGFQLKEVVKAVAREFNLPKSDVYKEALKIKERLKI